MQQGRIDSKGEGGVGKLLSEIIIENLLTGIFYHRYNLTTHAFIFIIYLLTIIGALFQVRMFSPNPHPPPTLSLRSGHIYMKNAHNTKSNEKSYVRFLFCELYLILFTIYGDRPGVPPTKKKLFKSGHILSKDPDGEL